MEPPDWITEKALAAELSVERDVLKRMRKSDLVEGADWRNEMGTGIVVTADGQKKIKAALALAAAPPAAPEPAPRDIIIRCLCRNPRTVEGIPDDGEARVLVRLNRGPSPHYRKGMVLPGCRPLPYAEQWEYPGPPPRRPGKF